MTESLGAVKGYIVFAMVALSCFLYEVRENCIFAVL